MPSVLLALLLMVKLVAAQNTKDSTKQVQDNRARVMVIPFDPEMYFNDADEDLAKYNNKNIKDIRAMFRYGLNVNLNAKILSQYQTRPLLTDTTKNADDDLYRIYKSVSYFKDKSIPNPNDPTKKESGVKKIFGKKDNNDEQNSSKFTEVDKNGLRTYINVKIYDVAMLDYLHKKYGVDLFVFLNQFNMVTDFARCLDRSTNTFERELAVHYSIFDYTGKQIAGDVAIVKFPSNSNDMMTIMQKNFPIISDYLAGNLPKHATRAPEEEEAKAENK